MKTLFSLLFLLCICSCFSQQSSIQNIKDAYANYDFETAYSLSDYYLKNNSKRSSAEAIRKVTDIYIECAIYLGYYNEAESKLDEVIESIEFDLGESDTSLVSYIAAKGNIQFALGNYSGAFDFFKRSLSLLEKTGLTNTYDYNVLLSNTGMLLNKMEENAAALQALKNCLPFFERNSEQYIYELALLYNNLADAYHSSFDFKKAGKFYQKSISNFSLAGDNSSVEYFYAIKNKALLQLDLGLIELAIAELRAAETLAKTNFGTESEEYASVLNDLGQAYKKQNNYALAEDYLSSAFNLKSMLFEQNHPSYITSKNNMAMFYASIGQLERAKTMLLEIFETIIKNDINNYPLLTYVNNLSNVYLEMNDIENAKIEALDVVKIIEQKEGKSSVNYFTALLGYATLLSNNVDDLALAQKYFAELNRLYPHLEKQLQYEDLLSYWNNKGALEMYTKHFDEAEKSFKTGLKNCEQLFNTDHPYYLLYESNLGFNYQLQNKLNLAYPYLYRSTSKELENIKRLFPNLTESEKELYIQKSRYANNHFNAFAISNYTNNPELLGDMFDLRLQVKGLVLRSSDIWRRKLESTNDVDLKSTYENWLVSGREIIKYQLLAKEELNALGINLEAKKAQIDSMEKALIKRVSSEGVLAESLSWKQLQKKLKPDEAAVELFRIQQDFPSDSVFYVALIVKPSSSQPEIVILDKGEDLDNREFKYYANSIEFKTENKRSYNAFWKPIAAKLTNCSRVYLSADGIYHKLNVNTLYNTESGKFAFEEITIVTVSSLNTLNNKLIQKYPKTISLFGHPNYYLDLKEALDNYSHNKAPKARTVQPIRAAYSDLPGTKVEVEAIVKLLASKKWKVSVFTEERAIENEVKKVNHLAFLHIATHGFFEQSPDTISRYSKESFSDPLMRSGLLFSGAGVPFSPSDLEDFHFYDDGLLYASEVLSMDLDGTECVVLSACQTGLGKIRNQEGVYGLQRAFLIAGAENVIMSLWPVDDAATKDFMISFYTHFIENNHIQNAFQKALTDTKNKYSDPYYWGAFVLLRN